MLRRLRFLLFLTILSALPARAQSRRAVYSIAGSVRDQTGQQALENIQVTLKQSTGTPISSTFTRGNGEFEFLGLPSGDYSVEINLKDYEPVRETVTVSSSDHLGVSIFLTRTTRVVNSSSAATISAHQLSVPHKAHDEYEKGMMLAYVKSDYQAAIVEFQRAIKDFPTYYEAYAEEGDAYYRLGEMGSAEDALRKSLEFSSGQYSDASFTLAALLTDTKRYEEAETIARKGITSDASSWRGPFELARALNALKKPEEAEKNAVRARDLMPDNAPVYLLLANIHIQKHDLPALSRDLDDYLRLAPNGSEADQAKKTRERVQAMMNSAKTDSDTDADADDDETPQATPKETRPAPRKEPSPPVEPDTSGLPSLPPPTAGNP